MSGHERLELSILRGQRRSDLDPSLAAERKRGPKDSEYSEERDVIAEEIARRHKRDVGNNWRQGDLENDPPA